MSQFDALLLVVDKVIDVISAYVNVPTLFCNSFNICHLF